MRSRIPREELPQLHPRRHSEPDPPAPTLREYRKGTHWTWVCCRNWWDCGHRAKIALVPYMIRWGMDASSDLLMTRFRCTACGRKGATLEHPSWSEYQQNVPAIR
jgi:hypothetical protein